MTSAAACADPADADSAFDLRREALLRLRKARRRNRIANLDKFDAFYKAYVTGIFGTLGVYVAAGWFGEAPIRGATLDTIASDGPSYLALLVVLVFAIGLRSGGRGGPLAFEHADVRHVLLSPVDRAASVREPARALLRHTMFLGAVVGGLSGVIALRRLPQLPIEWMITGALFGALTGGLGVGIAMVFGGRRISSWIADVAAVISLGWAIVDAYWHLSTSPFTWIGKIALWPLDFDPLAFAGIASVAAIIIIGLISIDGLSIEAAERRSRLVGQLRFAATLQDVRTVMVLQRQLSQEHLRQRPWIRLPRTTATQPTVSVFVRRSLAGLFRWPLFRAVRFLFFVGLAACATWGAWEGSSALIVVAGTAMWVAALDLLEPLAQETDHPDRLRSISQATGWVMARHLIVPFVVTTICVAIAAVPAVLFGDSRIVSALWPITALFICLPLGGAALSVTRPLQPTTGSVQTPEIAGLQFFWRAFAPPTLAILAFVPLVFARKSWDEFHSIDKMLLAVNWPVAIGLALGTWAFVWIRFGGQMRTKFESMGAEAVGGPEAAKRVPRR